MPNEHYAHEDAIRDRDVGAHETHRAQLIDSLASAAEDILAISSDGIVSIDEAQRIIRFNRGAEEIFGYSAAEVLGEPLERLLPQQFRAGHSRHVEMFGQGPVAARRMGE